MEDQIKLNQVARLVTMGSLAACVAHEINNPMTYILTNLSLMAEELAATSGGSKLEPLLSDITEGILRIQSIVSDLKALSPSNNKNTQGAVDLERVIDTAIKMARTKIRHVAKLREDCERGLIIKGIESQLVQVVLNLLINAAQAIPEGGNESHEIGVRTYHGAGNKAVIEVSDTGVGIAPENLSKIFEPFFSTKHIGDGTGLGLSISRDIVRELGGDITVESKLGRGTRFRLQLPIFEEGQVVATENAPPLAPQAARARILIVDDESSLAESISCVLSKHYDVCVASSGEEALAKLNSENRPFDLILCDLIMTGMTGMELYEKLLAEKSAMVGRMIFMTGDAFLPNTTEFLSRYNLVPLEKPFNSRRVRELIGSRVKS